ncbi:uncharacterized protein HMPREF1541_01737 [Cyphellophora europaea CBS 101466]|uniref:Potassium channel tetramerisation-type BTB domain-containing protein n=1 Tax=Cyphellophora europaea (strain CBS 101466) TaxID=1220924 RepID=W2S1X2_CYPE1|nr:uncharacterized protein HMPREF1541_01737 [Cyphellophora europaea CBS 101466]ETN42580.1 hypothetical protein HMPREF1541_01737 [Cyphellophora europaea CBS 101466]
MSGRGPASPDETEAQSDKSFTQGRPPTTTSQQARRTRQSAASTPRSGPIPVPPVSTAETPGQRAGFRAGTRPPSGHPPSILPPEKVFPIQIGSDLFRLSGASISSDAPSYFTQFFEEQIRQNEESGGVRTLYIDRDPITFRDIARHLQGYYVKPQDGSHFVKLFADAQFYSLPRLIDQLFESEIFIQIGERHFQIPKDVFSEPGNSPNFFSLGFAVFFSTPGEVFPGLDRRGLLRPPSITPPYVPGRSAEIFAELLHLLRGYPLHIRNESHRAELLRDCRYFHLRGLEQKIIAHSIAYNLARERHEITLRLEDVKPSGVSFTPDASSVPSPPSSPSHHTLSVPTAGWVSYARPFTDETSYELVVEIGGESMQLDLTDMRADFHNLTKARVGSLFQVVANKMNLPTNAPLGLMVLSQGQGQAGEGKSPGHTPLSEDRVKVRFEEATSVTLDGERIEVDASTEWGRRMLYGPDAGDESQDEDEAMGEEDDEEEEQQPPPPPPSSMGRQTKTTAAHRPSPAAPGQKHHPSQQPQQQPQQRPNPHQIPQQSRTHAAPPPIQTGHPPTDPRESATSQSKKRKRPSTSNPSPAQPIPSKQQEQQPATEWIIRAAQWRLRVQPNPQDSIRGGLEIVFVGVKVDAFSGEKGRNEQRGFLSAG